MVFTTSKIMKQKVKVKICLTVQFYTDTNPIKSFSIVTILVFTENNSLTALILIYVSVLKCTGSGCHCTPEPFHHQLFNDDFRKEYYRINKLVRSRKKIFTMTTLYWPLCNAVGFTYLN